MTIPNSSRFFIQEHLARKKIRDVLALTERATPSERFVLKIAAALLKQIDQEYEIEADTDGRIKLSEEECDWLPGTFEVWNSIATPKRWAIPERMEAVRQDELRGCGRSRPEIVQQGREGVRVKAWPF
jgi:hypothetical protein